MEIDTSAESQQPSLSENKTEDQKTSTGLLNFLKTGLGGRLFLVNKWASAPPPLINIPIKSPCKANRIK